MQCANLLKKRRLETEVEPWSCRAVSVSDCVWRRSSGLLTVQWKRPTLYLRPISSKNSRWVWSGPDLLSAVPDVWEENQVTSTTSRATEELIHSTDAGGAGGGRRRRRRRKKNKKNRRRRRRSRRKRRSRRRRKRSRRRRRRKKNKKNRRRRRRRPPDPFRNRLTASPRHSCWMMSS
ncbi:peptidyl-prolyl cis-trans isomerase 1-like isoform X1 [Dicentrarchus labrax]|uniref:peptidyl-prolyl cis-trans isomerase 1-like isoform X1 n=1 Tax=Dicentrarchus labrax TaxID=13489 RepID=UPI0021F5E954|nr:peptidyl-prolyl cis-trans isomerase 1-like isoform X1 [Dicentrarchus labrax]